MWLHYCQTLKAGQYLFAKQITSLLSQVNCSFSFWGSWQYNRNLHHNNIGGSCSDTNGTVLSTYRHPFIYFPNRRRFNQRKKQNQESRRIGATHWNPWTWMRVCVCQVASSAPAQQEQVAAKRPTTAGVTKPGTAWSWRAGGVGFSHSYSTRSHRV